jgi:hypothetical protein
VQATPLHAIASAVDVVAVEDAVALREDKKIIEFVGVAITVALEVAVGGEVPIAVEEDVELWVDVGVDVFIALVVEVELEVEVKVAARELLAGISWGPTEAVVSKVLITGTLLERVG